MGKQQDEDTDQDKSTERSDAEDSTSEDQNGDEENHDEGHGNLRRRSDWFQKRHGGG